MAVPAASVDGVAAGTAATTTLADIQKLKPLKSIEVAALKITVRDVTVVRHWVFGNFGSGSLSNDADKDSLYVVINYDVSTKDKNPKLPCVHFVTRNSESLTFDPVAFAGPQFRRWDSYGTMLGNSPDTGNDFAKSDTVQFASGGQVTLDDLKTKQLYIAFSKSLTLERTPANRPAIEYEGACPGRVLKNVSLSTLTRYFDVVEVRGPRAY